MDLDSMRYSDLRRLAKEAGLKANMKADKLQKALKQYYDKQKKTENGNDVGTVDVHVESAEDQDQLNVANNAAFVTERRGRGQRVKRKHPADGDTGNDSDLMQPASPKQGVVKFAEVEEEGNRNSKRRKVSLAKDDEPEPKAIQKTFNPCHDDAVMNTGEGKNMVKPGKIPRHEGLMKKNKNTIRPTTPNFRKLHEAHFNKMESIDSYVQRKNKQMEVFRNSVKELKSLSEKTILKPLDKKDSASKAKVSRASLFSPQVQERGTSSDRRRCTQASAGQSALKDSTAFKPTVLTTNKINVKFSRSIQDDDNKRCLVKTPAHTSPLVIVTSTPGRKSAVRGKPEGNKSTGLTNKTPGLTPFVFNGDTSASSTPCTTKKNTFNLKASLSRPLTYKPHKGKLKPFGATQENATLNKSQNIPSHQKNYKQHQVQTREERRTKQTEGRKQKKENMLGARRGLVMA